MSFKRVVSIPGPSYCTETRVYCRGAKKRKIEAHAIFSQEKLEGQAPDLCGQTVFSKDALEGRAQEVDEQTVQDEAGIKKYEMELHATFSKATFEEWAQEFNGQTVQDEAGMRRIYDEGRAEWKNKTHCVLTMWELKDMKNSMRENAMALTTGSPLAVTPRVEEQPQNVNRVDSERAHSATGFVAATDGDYLYEHPSMREREERGSSVSLAPQPREMRSLPSRACSHALAGDENDSIGSRTEYNFYQADAIPGAASMSLGQATRYASLSQIEGKGKAVEAGPRSLKAPMFTLGASDPTRVASSGAGSSMPLPTELTFRGPALRTTQSPLPVAMPSAAHVPTPRVMIPSLPSTSSLPLAEMLTAPAPSQQLTPLVIPSSSSAVEPSAGAPHSHAQVGPHGNLFLPFRTRCCFYKRRRGDFKCRELGIFENDNDGLRAHLEHHAAKGDLKYTPSGLKINCPWGKCRVTANNVVGISDHIFSQHINGAKKVCNGLECVNLLGTGTWTCGEPECR